MTGVSSPVHWHYFLALQEVPTKPQTPHGIEEKRAEHIRFLHIIHVNNHLYNVHYCIST